MTDTIIGAFIGVGGAIIGAIIAGPIAYFFSNKLVSKTHNNTIDLMQRQEFNKAATDFRNAFLPEIIFLKHNANTGNIGSTDDLSNVLLFGYVHRHLEAFESFKNHLSAEDGACIDKAWKQYCYNQDNPDILFFEQYFTGGRPKNEIAVKQTLALERIEEILKFAKHK